jgi:hypothetical protein
MEISSGIILSDFMMNLLNEINKTSLSKFSIASIQSTIRKLGESETKTFLEDLKKLIEKTENLNSKYTVLSHITSLFKHTSLAKQISEEEIKEIVLLYQSYGKLKKEKMYETTPNIKQADRFIDYEELKKATDKMASSLDKLILALYTYQPPLRSDYNSIKIINGKYDELNFSNSQNYYTLKDNIFHINEYKTCYKYGTIKNKAPIKLKNLIVKSLTDQPRDYLIYNQKKQTINEPITANYLGHEIQRITEKLFNKSISINDIRHSFINKYNVDNTDVKTVINNAKKMGHSITIANMEYKKHF